MASLLPPNADVLRAENRALQTLCRGPWNAIPPNVLKAVEQIGMPSQATDLTVLAIASKVRVAHIPSQNVFGKSFGIDAIYDGFDIVLKYLDYKLSNFTCIQIICNVYSDFVVKNSAVVDGSGVFSQTAVYQKLLDPKSPFCFSSFISLKVNRILGHAPADFVVSQVFEAYKFASQ